MPEKVNGTELRKKNLHIFFSWFQPNQVTSMEDNVLCFQEKIYLFSIQQDLALIGDSIVRDIIVDNVVSHIID